MRKFILLLIFFSGANIALAQELNCTVSVNSDFVNQTNQQIFKTLERELTDYVNKTKWTETKYATQERINCSMVINVSEYQNDQFTATLQVQAARPVYGSTYETPTLNFQDGDFTFRYLEFQPLVFNPNTFESNLTSVITFYVYIILGIDADTFQLNGGREHFNQAQKIANLAQSSGFGGWNQDGNLRNRYWLIDNLKSNTFKEYHTVMYQYHRYGLDRMHDNPKQAKQKIASSLRLFDIINNRRPNAFLIQIFFDAKSDEIQGIFSDGPSINIVQTKDILNRVAPFFASKWESIKF
ncbi:DUF4835 family protein [Sungkyunkwania multivorans]|uniref:DUF4835 family protein n=1 Tax=Sungkyunkwania multivorans TaxID=1173618 RepID=A0ABW3CXP1_9FLAO